MNTTIVGNLTDTPELRFTQAGKAVAKATVAVNNNWVDKASGEKREESHFFDIVCWGTLAENIAESLAKGTRVLVEGRLRQERWEAEDGTKRSRVVIVADEVAPSLRWSTATVVRNDRPERPKAPLTSEPFDADEEPF